MLNQRALFNKRENTFQVITSSECSNEETILFQKKRPSETKKALVIEKMGRAAQVGPRK